MLDMLMLIAQGTQPPAGGPPAGLSCGPMMIPMALMGVVFYFLLIRPQGKEKKRRAEMIAAIKKNDRVSTIGGIQGTVVSVKDNEITLKVDESNNTKITFLRSAIQSVPSGGTPETPDLSADKKK